jgi:uncharacterized protein DUF2695
MHYNSAISPTVRKVAKMEQSVAKVAQAGVAQAGTCSGRIARAEVVEVEVADPDLARLAEHLTEPGEHECLRCFLMRMIREFGCDGTHRWTIRWRDLRAPRARGLVGRMRRGGGCCDCEVVFNVFPGYPGTGRTAPCGGILRDGSADPRLLRKSA